MAGWCRSVLRRRLSLVLAVCLSAAGAGDALALPTLTPAGPPFGTGAEPRALAFSPSGDLLAVANYEDDTLSIFSVSNAGVLTPMGDPLTTGDGPGSVTFSRWGLVATANELDNSVSVFKVEDGTVTVGPTLPTELRPTSIAFGYASFLIGGSDQLAVANSGSNSVSLYSVWPNSPPVPTGAVPVANQPRQVAFSPGRGHLLATVHGDGSLRTYALGTGSLTNMAFGRSSVRAATFGEAWDTTAGGLLVATNAVDRSVSLSRVSSDGALQQVGPSIATGLSPDSVAFDGTHVVVANAGSNTVSTYSVVEFAEGQLELEQAGSPTPTGGAPSAVAFGPGGFLAVANAGDDTVSMYSISAVGHLSPIGSPTRTGGDPRSLAFSPGVGRFLATANASTDSVSMFEVSSDGGLASTDVSPTGDRPESVAFSPGTGRFLATANEESDSVSTFEVSAAGKLTPVDEAPAGDAPTSVAFSSGDGDLMAAANTGADSVSVFRVSEGGEVVSVAEAPTGDEPVSVAFSQDGALLATADQGSDTVSIFEVSTTGGLTSAGSPIATGAGPRSVAFSREGLLVTANSAGNSISLFKVDDEGSPTPIAAPPIEWGPSSAAFSADGRMLAIAHWGSNVVSLFSVSTEGAVSPVAAPSPTGQQPTSVAFAPGGRLLATTNALDGSISAFPLAIPWLDVSISGPPGKETRATEATFEFEANAPATFECRLDGGAFVPCTTPWTDSGLAAGNHRFEVRSTDLPGTHVSEPAGVSWLIDDVPPLPVQMLSPRDGFLTENLSNPRRFTWFITSDNATGIDRYELWIDEEQVGTRPTTECDDRCTLTAPTLSDGPHSWWVRAVDGVGNHVDTPTRHFSIDAAPPAAFALAAPPDEVVTTNRAPTLSWEATADAGVGLAGYDVVIDDQVVTSLDPAATSFTPGTLGEGDHRWQVVARDFNEQGRASETRRFTIDATAPVAALTGAPNPALAGRTVTFDAGGSSDATSGIARYAWDLDGDGAFEHDTGPTPTVARAYQEPGTFAVRVRVTDRAGLSATARLDQRVTVDNRGRGQLGVSINDGARYTNDPKVTIAASWPTFAHEMLISNDGGFKAAQPFGLRASVPWVLDSSGAERLPKIVYVRFMRGATVSETYTDDIILDQRAPLISSARLKRGKGAPLLRLRARDRGLAGLKAVQVTNDRRRPRAALRAYDSKLRLRRHKGDRRLKLGKPVFVRVRDRAGNVSSWRTVER